MFSLGKNVYSGPLFIFNLIIYLLFTYFAFKLYEFIIRYVVWKCFFSLCRLATPCCLFSVSFAVHKLVVSLAYFCLHCLDIRCNIQKNYCQEAFFPNVVFFS